MDVRFGGVSDTNNDFGYKISSLLPVSLVFFSAEAIGNIVELKWETETEINNHGFDIQRSTAGGNWETIGFVGGAGQSTGAINYGFTDRRPFDGLNYRLKQIDFDDEFEFSTIDVIRVDTDFSNPIVLYPNQASTDLFVLNASGSGEIYNLLGKRIQVVLFKEDQTNWIDVSSFARGVYHLVVIHANGERTVERFIK